MYLARTPAIASLRTQLDQAGRELVTVLAGLEALAQTPPGNGRASTAPEGSRGAGLGRGRHPWTDLASRDAAIRQARRFAHDAALARIVDAVDVWLARLRRVEAFCRAVPPLATQERGVKARLEALAEGLDAACTRELAVAHLAIQWRNRRQHSGAVNRLEQRYVATLRGADEALLAHYGLAADGLLGHFEASRSPRLRELNALSHATREACTQLDRALAVVTPARAYAEGALGEWFREAEKGDDENERQAAVWAAPPDKRRGRLEHLLRRLGFREQPLADGQEALDGEWLDALASAGQREAAARFGLVEERTEER